MHDADEPEHPHIVCADGYAWHPDPKRWRCFRGHTSAPAERVGAVLSGKGIDRVWALRCLILGDGEDGERWPGIVAILWPDPCDGCGRGHYETARLWHRAALSVHPDALDALREADPPLRALIMIHVPPERRHRTAREMRYPGLPVRDTSEQTARAQISWALDLAARKEFPVDAPQKRQRRRVRDVTEG